MKLTVKRIEQNLFDVETDVFMSDCTNLSGCCDFKADGTFSTVSGRGIYVITPFRVKLSHENIAKVHEMAIGDIAEISQ